MAAGKAKKKERQKDFQKAKLKVGKVKPKAANHTDTSFKARRITVNQQSLALDAPSSEAQFKHHVALLSSASETQRKESLSWLESSLSAKTIIKLSSVDLLDRLLPLLADANGSVRTRLIKTLRAIPHDDLELMAERILLHIWAGMTNINVSIRASALELLDWAIDACGIELVECKGGWFTTLQTYLVMLGWSTIGDSSIGWSSGVISTGDSKNIARALEVLTNFLQLGMRRVSDFKTATAHTDWWSSVGSMHDKPDPYRGLSLCGQSQDDSNSYTRDAIHRREIFLEQFRSRFETGIKEIKKQAGEAGRAAAKSSNIISEAMVEADTAKDLQDSWANRMEQRTRLVRDDLWSKGFVRATV